MTASRFMAVHVDMAFAVCYTIIVRVHWCWFDVRFNKSNDDMYGHTRPVVWPCAVQASRWPITGSPEHMFCRA